MSLSAAAGEGNPLQSSESWLPIPGLDGYEASDMGRVRSVDRVIHYELPTRWGKIVPVKRFRTGQVLALSTHPKTGYRIVTIRGKSWTVHTLILLAFVGPAPADTECRHLDGNNENNYPSNLAWGTRKENTADRIQHGTHVTFGRNDYAS